VHNTLIHLNKPNACQSISAGDTEGQNETFWTRIPIKKRKSFFFSNVASEYLRWSNGFQNVGNYQLPSESRYRNARFKTVNNNFAEIKQSVYLSEERAQNQNYFDIYQNLTCQSTLELSSHTNDDSYMTCVQNCANPNLKNGNISNCFPDRKQREENETDHFTVENLEWADYICTSNKCVCGVIGKKMKKRHNSLWVCADLLNEY
jgi:hypothetical protein